VALVATELTTNLVKHAGGGEISICPFDDAEGRGLRIAGPRQGARDRRSQQGLGGRPLDERIGGHGARRHPSQRDVFSLSSASGRGTAILARLKPAGQAAAKGASLICGLCAPYPGESVSGDGWSVRAEPGNVTLLMVDGSGHGPEAHKAALRAI
jgi:hypothetical protein